MPTIEPFDSSILVIAKSPYRSPTHMHCTHEACICNGAMEREDLSATSSRRLISKNLLMDLCGG